MSHAIRRISGRGLPLPGNDVDTDQIIESRYLKLTSFRGIENHLFEGTRARQRAGGGKPHPFDLPAHRGASILLTGRNFGCGSSREHAPQALYRYGIRAILGESFGEIFAGNCLGIGLPCLTMGAVDGAWLGRLCAESPNHLLEVDIARGEVSAAGRTIEAALPDGRRKRLLDGSWDPLAALLSNSDKVKRHLSGLPPIIPPVDNF